MEKVCFVGLNKNIKFICKQTTNLAESFLKSPFGEILKIKKFRIITDMTRPNEEDGENAGANICSIIKNLKYESCRTMIFTSSKSSALMKIKNRKLERNNLFITQITKETLDFIYDY